MILGIAPWQTRVGNHQGKMIRALGGKRVKALHVHDNDLVRDVHTLPFTRKIDWDRGYDGTKGYWV